MTMYSQTTANDAEFAKELREYDWGGAADEVVSRQHKNATGVFSRPVRIELPVFGKGGAAFSSAEYWAKRLGQGARIPLLSCMKWLTAQCGKRLLGIKQIKRGRDDKAKSKKA